MRARPTALTVSLFVVVVGVGLWLGTRFAASGYGLHAICAASWCIGLVQISDERRREVAQALRDALKETNIGVRDAAAHMQLDPADFSRALTGERKLDIWRIEMLPVETRRCFYFFRAQRLGLPTFVQRALKIAPAFDGREKGVA
jgi:uncharacterized membrane protein